MTRHRRHLLHLLLTIALVVAGMPAHAGGHAMPASPTDAESGLLDQNETAENDCPLHASSSGPSDIGTDKPSDNSPSEDCCGPDCRCSCAGLTLVPVRSLTAPVVTAPAATAARLATNRPSHLTSAPLRPPQVWPVSIQP